MFFCLVCEFRRPIFVLYRILRTDNIVAVRPKNLFRGSDIEIRCYLNKSIGCLFRRIEFLLPWLGRSSGSCFAAACFFSGAANEADPRKPVMRIDAASTIIRDDVMVLRFVFIVFLRRSLVYLRPPPPPPPRPPPPPPRPPPPPPPRLYPPPPRL